MKYIKKLNIDFDQWDELKNKYIYLIFKSINFLYIGYIIKINNEYRITLLNINSTYGLHVIDNIYKISNDQIIVYNDRCFRSINILYGDLIKSDFYKNNKILIVGIDVNKEDILKNPELYSNNGFKTIIIK
jgi:hypothetical protein